MKKNHKTKTVGTKSVARQPSKDAKREERIAMEIIVDAYTPEEQAMGWYYYLEERVTFPVSATCIKERAISPLQTGDTVKILAMAPEDECGHEMFVEVDWQGKRFAVPLVQLEPGKKADNQTREAIEDWHNWQRRAMNCS